VRAWPCWVGRGWVCLRLVGVLRFGLVGLVWLSVSSCVGLGWVGPGVFSWPIWWVELVWVVALRLVWLRRCVLGCVALGGWVGLSIIVLGWVGRVGLAEVALAGKGWVELGWVVFGLGRSLG